MPENEGNGKPKKTGAGRILKRFVVTTLIIAAILVVTAFLVVRTDGGRSMIQDWLGKRLGATIVIKETRMELPFTLVMENVESKDNEPGGKPLLKVQEIAIKPGFGDKYEVSIRRAALNVVRTGESGWSPVFFSRLGDVPFRNIGEISRVVRKLGRDLTIHVSDSSINWMESGGAVTASVSGVSFDATPVELPDRKMYHFKLSVYGFTGTDGNLVNDIEREWLSTDTKDYIEVQRSGKGVPEDAFWDRE